MTSSSALDAGRAAAAERHWADAYELLARVDATDGLAASDLDLLSTVALLRGEPPVAVDALSRAYEAHLAGNDTSGAARSAGWLVLNLIELGDFTRSVAWAARAMRLVSAMAEPGALAGFVRLGPAVAQLGSGNPAEARQEFEDVLAIAERHGDDELASLTMIGLGKSLIEVDAIAEGFACFDRAMAAVAVGEVEPVHRLTGIPTAELRHRRRQSHEPGQRARLVHRIDDPHRAGCPEDAVGEIPQFDELEREPPGGASGASGVAARQMRLVRPRPSVDRGGRFAAQDGDGREQLEVGCREPLGRVDPREALVRVGPAPLRGGRAARVECAGRGHVAPTPGRAPSEPAPAPVIVRERYRRSDGLRKFGPRTLEG